VDGQILSLRSDVISSNRQRAPLPPPHSPALSATGPVQVPPPQSLVAGEAPRVWCSHVTSTALEPLDCLRANNRTQLTALRFRALLVKHRSLFLRSKTARTLSIAKCED
jgi:hypothetical protein